MTKGGDGPARGRALNALVAILALGFAARVLCVLVLSPYDRFTGGDGPWYARQAWLMLHAALPVPLSTVGPLYPLLLSGLWLGFPEVADPVRAELIPAAYLTLVRTVQTGFGVLTAWAGWRLARHLTGSDRWALVAAAGVGLGPAFVMEPFQILTESLFMMLLTAAVLLHVTTQRAPTARTIVATGAVFGLATLTRPVLWPFPVVVAVDLMLRHGRRAGVGWAALLLVGYLTVLAPWHAYLQFTTGRPGPQGLQANFWIGAVGEGRWTGSHTLDALRGRFPGGDEDYATEAVRAIRADPVRWMRLRAQRLGEAILQPHGTSDLRGPPVKAALAVLAGTHRTSEAAGLVGTGSFWLKLAIYVFHYTALLVGAAGMWLARRQWRDWLVLYAVVAYLCVVYGLLTVLPRYLFPAEVFAWVFAAAGAAGIWRHLTT